MKKLIATIAVAAAALSAVPAHADQWRRGPYHGGGPRYYQHHRHGGNWIAPLIGGAIIGGVITNQYYQRPPAYYPPGVYTNAYPQPVYLGQTVCRPVQAVDQYGYTYWTQQCWQQ